MVMNGVMVDVMVHPSISFKSLGQTKLKPNRAPFELTTCPQLYTWPFVENIGRIFMLVYARMVGGMLMYMSINYIKFYELLNGSI